MTHCWKATGGQGVHREVESEGLEDVVFHAIPPEFTKLFREARLRISHVDPLLQERNGCKRTRKLHAIRRLPGSRFCLPFQIRPISQPFRDGGIWYKSDEKKLETTEEQYRAVIEGATP